MEASKGLKKKLWSLSTTVTSITPISPSPTQVITPALVLMATPVATPGTAFFVFPKLPNEIKDHIWKMACMQGRVYEIYEQRDLRAKIPMDIWQGIFQEVRHQNRRSIYLCPVKARTPGLFHACRGSRKVAAQFVISGNFCQPEFIFKQCLTRSIAFNFSKDTLLMCNVQAMLDFLGHRLKKKDELAKLKVLTIGSIHRTLELEGPLGYSNQFFPKPMTWQQMNPSLMSIVHGIVTFGKLQRVVLLVPKDVEKFTQYAGRLELIVKSQHRLKKNPKWMIPEIVVAIDKDVLGYTLK